MYCRSIEQLPITCSVFDKIAMNQLHEAMTTIEAYQSRSFKQLENGTRLYCQVPSKGEGAWLHAVYSPMNGGDLEHCEILLNTALPDPLKEFYLFANGMYLYSGSLSFYGIRKSFTRNPELAWQPFDLSTPNIYERISDAKPWMIFIAAYDWDGSLVYYDVRDNTLSLCRATTTRPVFQWASLWEMVNREVVRLASHFDKFGVEIDPQRTTLPSVQSPNAAS